MGLDTLVILPGIAFWLGCCYGRNRTQADRVVPVNDIEQSRPAFDWTALEIRVNSHNMSKNGDCADSGKDSASPGTDTDSAVQGKSDSDGVEGEGPEVVARFLADGRLVFEEKALAARRNGADLDRRRRVC